MFKKFGKVERVTDLPIDQIPSRRRSLYSQSSLLPKEMRKMVRRFSSGTGSPSSPKKKSAPKTVDIAALNKGFDAEDDLPKPVSPLAGKHAWGERMPKDAAATKVQAATRGRQVRRTITAQLSSIDEASIKAAASDEAGPAVASIATVDVVMAARAITEDALANLDAVDLKAAAQNISDDAGARAKAKEEEARAKAKAAALKRKDDEAAAAVAAMEATARARAEEYPATVTSDPPTLFGGLLGCCAGLGRK